MRFLLDTNAISDVVRRPDGPTAHRYDAEAPRCCTSIVVAGEIRYGIAKKPDAGASGRAARFLEGLSIFNFEAPADLFYGSLRATLERNGTPIGANDMLIAAHALALDLTLVTANEREFRRVPGLRVENWRA
jgi:tRNA(fMet)-specific endonuclease VapC